MDFAYSLQLNAAFLVFFRDYHIMGPFGCPAWKPFYKCWAQEALLTWPWTSLV